MSIVEEFKVSYEIVSLMKKDNKQLDAIDNEDIQYMISMLVNDYLATIGRGLARTSNENSYEVVTNNKLNVELLKGLFFRIPITFVNREKFIQLLVEDLKNYTKVSKKIGNYSVLEQSQNCIMLKNIQKTEKKKTNYL